LKLVWFLNEGLPAMILADKWEVIANASNGPSLRLLSLGPYQDFDDLSPKPALTSEKLAIAKHVEASLSTRQRNAYPVDDVEKADRSLVVAAD